MWCCRKLKLKDLGKNLRVRWNSCLLKTSQRLMIQMSLPLALHLWECCQWLFSIIYRLDWTTTLAGGIQRLTLSYLFFAPLIHSILDIPYLWSNPVYFLFPYCTYIWFSEYFVSIYLFMELHLVFFEGYTFWFKCSWWGRT